MTQYSILINLDKKTYDDLHKVMGLTIEKDGLTRYRLFDDTKKQPMFRKILRAGMESYIRKFEAKKTELENEN